MDQITEKSKLNRQKKKSLRNSIFSMVAFVFITVLIFSAQTYAYFTDNSQSEKNRIASGTLEVELIEMQNTDQGQIAYVNPVEIMPGTEVSKIVKVQNTGSLPMYVRIKIEKSINKPENELPDGWRDLIECNFNLDDESTVGVKEGLWTYRDGYYYYNEPLKPGKTTVPLFDAVSFSADMGNEFTNSTILFTVSCQATQANGNADTAMDAIGWPPEESESTETTPDESTEAPDESTDTPDESTETPDESTEIPDESTDTPDESTDTPDVSTEIPDTTN